MEEGLPIRGLWSSRHTTPSDWCFYFRSWLLAPLRRYGLASEFSLMATSLLCPESHQSPITIKMLKARHGGPAFGPWPLGPRKSAVSDGCPAVGLTNRWVAFRRASIPLGGSHSLCGSAWKRLCFKIFASLRVGESATWSSLVPNSTARLLEAGETLAKGPLTVL